MSGQVFDYVIVGAGSAGCVLANRLSEDPTVRVALIEAGGRDRNPWIHIPAGYYRNFSNPAITWQFGSGPEPHLDDRTIPWPRGRVLGGSSAINGLLYVRGQAQDFDVWRQLGNVGWSYRDVLPYFKRSEDQERGADDYHGTGGPLGVSDVRLRQNQMCEAFIEACAGAGIPRNTDFNGADQEGAGYFQLTNRNGRRCSAAVAYLRPARSRPNLSIITGALVHGLELDGRRATGVRCARNGQVETVTAAREVILAAGAIGSPHILQLSGIGPAATLQGRRRPRAPRPCPASARTCRIICRCASSTPATAPAASTTCGTAAGSSFSPASSTRSRGGASSPSAPARSAPSPARGPTSICPTSSSISCRSAPIAPARGCTNSPA